MRRRLVWRTALPFLTITLVALAAYVWYATGAFREDAMRRAERDLTARARLIEDEFRGFLATGDTDRIRRASVLVGRSSGTRVTVIRSDGLVLGDSMEDPSRMENHDDRPEIVAARLAGWGTAVRFSMTTQRDMMYVAIALRDGTRPLGFLRTSMPLADIESVVAEVRTRALLAGLIIAAIASLVLSIASRRLARPIVQMRQTAERIARGQFDVSLPRYETEETGALAEAMNSMARQLDERIHTILDQRNEFEAVLSSMVEGVIAIDADERVININRAAARLFDVDPARARGASLQEAVRNPDLQRFARRALASPEVIEDAIAIIDRDTRHLQAHGTVLRDGSGADIGAVIVLHDITRLRRLETVRKDFVANVSHELKTPVTSIKGFVETLLDGAIGNREDALRFLDIIAKQADRLQSIIEDLLSLSRIEQESGAGTVERRVEKVAEVLRAAVQVVERSAHDKRLRIVVECPPNLLATMNAELVEQALVNLLTNAVTYSGEGGEVIVRAAPENGGVRVSVRDFGIGIEARHLPRLFERFYRVDKARSRQRGGTGLGLSIVKHIAQAHGGRVDVQSAPGEGSTFSIIF